MPVKYNIYSKEDRRYIYTDCILVAMIPAYHTLTDDEVRMWFGIDEGHPQWYKCHCPFSIPRYVFDKCIVPASVTFRIEVVHEES